MQALELCRTVSSTQSWRAQSRIVQCWYNQSEKKRGREEGEGRSSFRQQIASTRSSGTSKHKGSKLSHQRVLCHVFQNRIQHLKYCVAGRPLDIGVVSANRNIEHRTYSLPVNEPMPRQLTSSEGPRQLVSPLCKLQVCARQASQYGTSKDGPSQLHLDSCDPKQSLPLGPTKLPHQLAQH